MTAVMLLEPAQQRKVKLPLPKNSCKQWTRQGCKGRQQESCWLAGELLTKVLFLALCEEEKRGVHEKNPTFL